MLIVVVLISCFTNEMSENRFFIRVTLKEYLGQFLWSNAAFYFFSPRI